MLLAPRATSLWPSPATDTTIGQFLPQTPVVSWSLSALCLSSSWELAQSRRGDWVGFNAPEAAIPSTNMGKSGRQMSISSCLLEGHSICDQLTNKLFIGCLSFPATLSFTWIQAPSSPVFISGFASGGTQTEAGTQHGRLCDFSWTLRFYPVAHGKP